ncbi:MAG: malto-oligosyltrehalose trehalohydrolase [Gemmatimonadota bacterium]
MRLGATPIGGNETEFVVWAPRCERVVVEIVQPVREQIELTRGEHDYFSGRAPVGARARYSVRPDGGEARPDPASRYQPEGVHGPSEVVDARFDWHDAAWRGLPLSDYIIYELHIGAFTRAGTFDSALERLDYLVQLGVTALEIMPVAQFPGARNWGYDGVLPFAVQDSYGGPAALKRLVAACHARGLAVILDVVYNHLGPEGNYLGEFGPYFTHNYKTPWGRAVNVDAEHSDGVRYYFIQNALEWITDYHFDGLRLDAVHGILDTSARPFLAELSDAVHERARQLGRAVHLIAESDLNDVRMIRPTRAGGMGMAGQWLDDFHHSLHALLTAESSGYYVDYGRLEHFATTLRQGYIFTGDYSAYRKRRHGNQPADARAEQFVVYAQNHDQVGNRMLGERLSCLVDDQRLKLAAACVLLSPYVPMLFMGEEYGERNPFPYFIDHSDAELVAAVRSGRREEFAAFAWQREPPDPQAEDTFASARVEPVANELFDLYRTLIALRKQHDLGSARAEQRDVVELPDERTVVLLRLGSALVLSFGERAYAARLPLPRGTWRKVFSTASPDPAPALITSPGSVCVELAPAAALLLVSEDET